MMPDREWKRLMRKLERRRAAKVRAERKKQGWFQYAKLQAGPSFQDVRLPPRRLASKTGRR